MRGLTLKRSQRGKNGNVVWNWSGLCDMQMQLGTVWQWCSRFTGHRKRHVLPSPWHFSAAPMSDHPLSAPPPHHPVANIRQHFNRVCAFAWKSLKLNASDGNLYASLCLRFHGRAEGKFEGHRRRSGISELGSVPKLICVGFSGNGTNFAGKGFGRCWPFCLFFFGRQHSSIGSWLMWQMRSYKLFITILRIVSWGVCELVRHLSHIFKCHKRSKWGLKSAW